MDKMLWNWRKICIILTLNLLVFKFIIPIVDALDAPKYERGKKIDPFIPIVTNEGQLTNVNLKDEENNELSLQGIIYEEKGISLAIIDGEIVKAGDVMGIIKVVEIKKDSIVYMKDGELFVLKAEKEQ